MHIMLKCVCMDWLLYCTKRTRKIVQQVNTISVISVSLIFHGVGDRRASLSVLRVYYFICLKTTRNYKDIHLSNEVSSFPKLCKTYNVLGQKMTASCSTYFGGGARILTANQRSLSQNSSNRMLDRKKNITNLDI